MNTTHRTRGKCPSCGRHAVVPVVYGFPSNDAFEAAERGEFALGGCVIRGGDATSRCTACGWDNGEVFPDEEFPDEGRAD